MVRHPCGRVKVSRGTRTGGGGYVKARAAFSRRPAGAAASHPSSAMSQKLRWGILGVAAINDRLMPAFRASKTVELRGIASRTLDKAKASAAKNGIPKAFGSYEELLRDPEIDAVYNPL